MGDIHGRIDKLNMFINKKNPDVIILLGDCAFHWYEPEKNIYSGVSGFWLDDSNFKKVKPNDTKIFWLMGNHQAWNYMELTYGRTGTEPVEMSPNLFYCPIGSTLNINGKNCLFVGGADSTDADTRVNRFEWFSEERLTDADYEHIASRVNYVDVMFSHTCPEEFDIQDKWDSLKRVCDPSRKILSISFANENSFLAICNSRSNSSSTSFSVIHFSFGTLLYA